LIVALIEGRDEEIEGDREVARIRGGKCERSRAAGIHRPRHMYDHGSHDQKASTTLHRQGTGIQGPKKTENETSGNIINGNLHASIGKATSLV